MVKVEEVELSELSLEELRALQVRVAAAIGKAEIKRREDAYNAAKNAAEKLGFHLYELVDTHDKPKRRKMKGAGVPKYANPSDQTQTWTGYGRKPGWILDAVNNGRDLEELKIA